MLQDERDPGDRSVAADRPALPLSRRWSVAVPVLGLLLLGGIVTSCLLRADRRHTGDDERPLSGSGGGDAQPSPPAQTLFRDWPAGQKPDVALILTGQQHSYLKFCGCSSPQLGGFERRYNFLAQLKARGWPLVALDLGDLVAYKSKGVHEQSVLKYQTAMKALKALDYAAIGLGHHDFTLPLLDGLSLTVLQNPSAFPVPLAANLADRENRFPSADNRSMIGDVIMVGGQNGVPRVGVIGVLGTSVEAALQGANIVAKPGPNNEDAGEKLKLLPNSEVLPTALSRLAAAKSDLNVLLYQGDFRHAMAVAQKLPGFHVILCLSEEEEPPSAPDTVGSTKIIRVGHKGRKVGVVGAFRTGNTQAPFDLRYQLVDMGEEYETPKDNEPGHRILALLDEYALEVKQQDFLKRYPKGVHPVQAQFPQQKATFVGSEQCTACHQNEYKVWKEETKHPEAYKALKDYAVKPKMRQYDPECIRCHTIGLDYAGGYVNEQLTAHLKGVGCENCHGPGSLHVADPKNPRYQLAMSPWKTAAGDRLPTPDKLKQGFEALAKDEQILFNKVNDACQQCHDTDNDPKFKLPEYWPKIAHGKATPKPVRVANGKD